MNKLIAKEDILILNKLFLKKNDVIEKKEEYSIETELGKIIIPFSTIEKLLKPEEDIKSIISVLDDDDEEVKTWRIQLDVKTSRKKIIEIENYLRISLKEYI